eukprot:scaffold1453_cov112-Isochrysis_galbana.AAC.20
MVSLLSDPVLAGFTSAASLLIGLSQLKHVVGFDVPRGSAVDMIRHAVAHVGELNPWALGVGAASFVSLKGLKTLNRRAFPWLRLPEQLVVVVASAVFAYATATDGAPLLPTVGRVPAGLPSPRWPVRGDSALVFALVRPALLVAFFSYVVTISVAKPFSLKNGYTIDPNQVETPRRHTFPPHLPATFFRHTFPPHLLATAPLRRRRSENMRSPETPVTPHPHPRAGACGSGP